MMGYKNSIVLFFIRLFVIGGSMFRVGIMLVLCGIVNMIGTHPYIGDADFRWLHFDDVAAQKITCSSPEYLLSNETP
jgi:hypothetical protein